MKNQHLTCSDDKNLISIIFKKIMNKYTLSIVAFQAILKSDIFPYSESQIWYMFLHIRVMKNSQLQISTPVLQTEFAPDSPTFQKIR